MEKLDRIRITAIVPGTAIAPDTIEFHINPSSCNSSRQHYETLQKVRAGFAKIFVGVGAYQLAFAGQLNLNPYFESRGFDGSKVGGDVKAPDDIRYSEAYKWMQRFIAYVETYAPYLFRLEYVGIPVDLSELKDPVFIGTMQTPAISRDANQPLILGYNFTFVGVVDPASRQIETGSGKQPKTVSIG